MAADYKHHTAESGSGAYYDVNVEHRIQKYYVEGVTGGAVKG